MPLLSFREIKARVLTEAGTADKHCKLAFCFIMTDGIKIDVVAAESE